MYSIQIIHVRKIHERYLQSTFNQSWKTWTSISWLFPYTYSKKRELFPRKKKEEKNCNFVKKGWRRDIMTFSLFILSWVSDVLLLHSPIFGCPRPLHLSSFHQPARGSSGSEGSRLSQIMTMMRSWWKRNCLLAWRRRRSLWCGLKASSNIVPGKLS